MSRAAPATENAGRRAGEGEDGFILVAVLWLLAALAGLAAIYLTYALNSASASFLPAERLQAEAAIRSGVELAAYQGLAVAEPLRPTHGAFEARIGRADVVVSYRSEAARLDLNAAPKDLLVSVLKAIGAAPDLADSCADRILGWRGDGDSEAKFKEAAAYKSARLDYGPRQGPFESTLELSLVLGLSPPLVERLLPLTTVYGGHGKIDIANADPTLVAALPGMTPELLKQVLAARANPNAKGEDLMKIVGPASKFATVDRSKATRASILVDLGHGRKTRAEVVFAWPDKGEEPYDILYWRDDFDGPLPPG